jgi:hypothetical protein
MTISKEHILKLLNAEIEVFRRIQSDEQSVVKFAKGLSQFFKRRYKKLRGLTHKEKKYEEKLESEIRSDPTEPVFKHQMKDMKTLADKIFYTFSMFGLLFWIIFELLSTGISKGTVGFITILIIVLVIIVYLKGYADSDILDKILKR